MSHNVIFVKCKLIFLFIYYYFYYLRRYSGRTNDRNDQHRSKGGERILKAYEIILENTMEVIGEKQWSFRVISEHCHTKNHNVS